MPDAQNNSPILPESAGSLTRKADGDQEPRNLLPWLIAGAVVLLVLAVLLVFGRHKTPPNPGGAGLAQADPYAVNLTISHVQMSESTNLSGGKVTYLDGEIANHGDRTLRRIVVQVAFLNALNEITQKETMPLSLIRTREPYVDTQPVSAAPVAPESSRPFRLIFDHVSPDWDQQYPEVRVIEVSAK